ncbi:MAG: hypothetical protein JNK09_17580 [Prolixibacteraceae bacterium]|nr:hypothetical protein [Prolixibacteraceae bacterium]
MRKFFFFTFCFSIVFVSYSNGVSLTKKPEYAKALNQSICRLNSHPKSEGAKNKVKETYDQAINFYQEEIDRILMGNDPLKWTKTLDVLETVNALGDEIRFNSSVTELICEPKIYTSEIDDAKSKAVVELYQAGEDCLKQNSREKAKEAYSFFEKASQINPDYKDISGKMFEARSYGMLKVLIEPIELDFKTVDVITDRLDKQFFYWTQTDFSKRLFVAFYSQEELQRQNANPDLVVKLLVQNFRISERPAVQLRNVGMPHPTKQLVKVDGKYTWVPIEGNQSFKSSEWGFVSNELVATGNLFLKVLSAPDQKVVFKRGISCEFQRNAAFSLGVNSVAPTNRNPDTQNFFDQLFLSNFDQITDALEQYFISISAMR